MKNRLKLIGAVILALLIAALMAAYKDAPFLVMLCIEAAIVVVFLFAYAMATIILRSIRYQGRTRTFANIAEGVHGDGCLPKKASAAIATRFFLFKFGADVDHVTVSTVAGEKCHFVVTDEAAAPEDLVNAAALGNSDGTQRMVANAAIAIGDALESAGNGKVRTIQVGAGHYEVGTALTAAAADGDVIEVAHCHPIHRPT